MGYNTVIMVLNDRTDEIEKNVNGEFTNALAQQMSGAWHPNEKPFLPAGLKYLRPKGQRF